MFLRFTKDLASKRFHRNTLILDTGGNLYMAQKASKSLYIFMIDTNKWQHYTKMRLTPWAYLLEIRQAFLMSKYTHLSKMISVYSE